MPESIAQLQVNPAELVTALTILSKTKKPRAPGDAVVSFEDGKMAIAALGLTLRASAEGTWSGQAYVPITFLIRLSTVPPLNEPVSVRVAEGRFYIETYGSPCLWTAREHARLELPINVTVNRLLTLGIHHSEEELARSGLLKDYKDAVRQRDAMIARAADTLAPLGVARDDVARLVDDSLRRQESE